MNSINNIIDWLESRQDQHQSDFNFERDYDLGKSSTMRLKSRGYFLKVYNIDFLQNLFKKFTGESFLIIGKGANSILSQAREDKIYLRLQLDESKQEVDQQFSQLRDYYWLPASTSLSQLVIHAKKYGLEKWEGLTGIPGTLGGAIFMNAGTKLGEISQILEAVQVIRVCGKREELQLSPANFSYRKNLFLKPGDIIIAAKLKVFSQNLDLAEKIKNYLDYRTQTQPLWEKTCGSVFKNNDQYTAGKTIDSTCLKGLRSGGLSVSRKHANFIVNNHGGNQSDFVRLTNALRQELELIYGVSFELEARFL